MRVGCRVRLTTADATKAPRRATRGCSSLTTVPRYDGAGAPRRSVSGAVLVPWRGDRAGRRLVAHRRAHRRRRASPLAAATSPAGIAATVAHARWHASLNALGEGAEYSEPEPSPVHRASDVSRSSTVAFESSRPSSAGRYSSKSSTGRYSELSRPSRATELATSGRWETPRPSCSPVLVEEEGPAAADTRGLDERLNEHASSVAAAAEPLAGGGVAAAISLVDRRRRRGGVCSALASSTREGLSYLDGRRRPRRCPGQRRPRRRGRVDLVRAARLVDALGKGRRRSRL